MRSILFFLALLPLLLFARGENQGKRVNIVCFVRFSDEVNYTFQRSVTEYYSMFNDVSSESAISVANYFKKASYGEFEVSSSIANGSQNELIIPFQSTQKRGYYMPSDPNNPIGYSGVVINMRESGLVRDVASYCHSVLPTDLLVDADGNGTVDNLTIVVSGSQSTSGEILYPHQAVQFLKLDYILGKRVASYNIHLDGSLSVGTLCHEFMHTLGAPDLYLSNKLYAKPIGNWDLMGTNGSTPQGMSAYTLYRYGGWIDAPIELTAEGTYQLNPLMGTTRDNIWFKVQEAGKSEYFVLEYRKKTPPFEQQLYSSGLLIYRINDLVKGNNNSNGTTNPYGQYLFRKDGSPTVAGETMFAALSTETGRTRFAVGASPYPFYSDGSEAQFEISQIGTIGDQISFYFKPIATSVPTLSKEGALRYAIDRLAGQIRLFDLPIGSRVEVYDLSGRLCQTPVVSDGEEFMLSSFTPGSYLLVVTDGVNGQRRSVKVIF